MSRWSGFYFGTGADIIKEGVEEMTRNKLLCHFSFKS